MKQQPKVIPGKPGKKRLRHPYRGRYGYRRRDQHRRKLYHSRRTSGLSRLHLPLLPLRDQGRPRLVPGAHRQPARPLLGRRRRRSYSLRPRGLRDASPRSQRGRRSHLRLRLGARRGRQCHALRGPLPAHRPPRARLRARHQRAGAGTDGRPFRSAGHLSGRTGTHALQAPRRTGGEEPPGPGLRLRVHEAGSEGRPVLPGHQRSCPTSGDERQRRHHRWSAPRRLPLFRRLPHHPGLGHPRIDGPRAAQDGRHLSPVRGRDGGARQLHRRFLWGRQSHDRHLRPRLLPDDRTAGPLLHDRDTGGAGGRPTVGAQHGIAHQAGAERPVPRPLRRPRRFPSHRHRPRLG